MALICNSNISRLQKEKNFYKFFWLENLTWTDMRKLISSVQFSCSVVSDSATPWTVACQASLSITNSQSLLKLMAIESVMPSNHLILWCPLLLPPSIFPSIRVFSNESVLRIRWPKYWSFSFSISPSNEHSGSISFRIDWFDLLAVQGTLSLGMQELWSGRLHKRKSFELNFKRPKALDQTVGKKIESSKCRGREERGSLAGQVIRTVIHQGRHLSAGEQWARPWRKHTQQNKVHGRRNQTACVRAERAASRPG